jgi:hypothetical protein
MKMEKNIMINPHIIRSVTRALKDRGNDHFLIWILQNRSTRGRPIIDKTPEIRMYTTILRKYQAQKRSNRIPRKIRMFLNVAFIYKSISLCKPNPNFLNSLKIGYHENVLTSKFLPLSTGIG